MAETVDRKIARSAGRFHRWETFDCRASLSCGGWRMRLAAITKQVRQLFVSAGMPARDAQAVAEIFVLQEMRGIKTHGLRRVERNLESLRAGEMNPRPKRRVLRDSGATVVLDGDNGVGLLGCREV